MKLANISQFRDALSAKSVQIMLPKGPSFDAVASGLALYVSLKSFGKQVSIACPTPMIVDFNRLVGVDKVEDKLGAKNLIIEFDESASLNIERVRYDGEEDSLRLVVLPVAGQEPPRRDQVKLSYSGADGDALVLLVGVSKRADLGKFEREEGLLSSKLVVVGTNPSHEFAGGIEVINPQSNTLAQVVLDVIEQAKLPIDGDIATNLFAGLDRGSGRFSADWVDSETFAAASRLMEVGAQRMPAFAKGGVAPLSSRVPEEDQGVSGAVGAKSAFSTSQDVKSGQGGFPMAQKGGKQDKNGGVKIFSEPGVGKGSTLP